MGNDKPSVWDELAGKCLDERCVCHKAAARGRALERVAEAAADAMDNISDESFDDLCNQLDALQDLS